MFMHLDYKIYKLTKCLLNILCCLFVLNLMLFLILGIINHIFHIIPCTFAILIVWLVSIELLYHRIRFNHSEGYTKEVNNKVRWGGLFRINQERETVKRLRGHKPPSKCYLTIINYPSFKDLFVSQEAVLLKLQ